MGLRLSGLGAVADSGIVLPAGSAHGSSGPVLVRRLTEHQPSTALPFSMSYATETSAVCERRRNMKPARAYTRPVDTELELVAVTAAQLFLRFRQVAACRRIGDETTILLFTRFYRRGPELSTVWHCRQHTL